MLSQNLVHDESKKAYISARNLLACSDVLAYPDWAGVRHEFSNRASVTLERVVRAKRVAHVLSPRTPP